jgi:ArsR family transcriptional regulator
MYRIAMSTRLRQPECCAPPVVPMPISGARQKQLIAGFKALSDPHRFEIFRLIAIQDAPICACDVVDRFALTQPTISHHLKVLREAGLITVSRRGVWAYYAAEPRGIALLHGVLSDLAPVAVAS